MPSKLHVVALISGGKDSLFSILHCLKNGHDVVALANLHPSQTAPATGHGLAAEGDDVNSFMYQTVGHSIIPLYEHALRLPLYRQPILGHAVITDKDYHHPLDTPAPGCVSSAGDDTADETESLFPLLRKVLAAHPDVNAVCTGAILSTYQRTRVESVCARLGLVPLGYLWQYPSLPPYADAALLRDMNAVFQDARIIKVASGGIDAGFLWQNVADQKTIEKLRRTAARFGGEGAVLGEGGEFETVAVDGPGCVWKGGRIEVDVDEEAVVGEGGSAVVRFKDARVVEKAPCEDRGLENLRTPDLFDVEFEELGRELLLSGPGIAADITNKSIDRSLANAPNPPLQSLSFHSTLHGATLTVSNITAPLTNNERLPPTSQLEVIKSHLLTLLSTHSANPSHITSTTLLLRSMSLFTLINPIYGTLFTSAPNPPARVTIACGSSLPPGIDVSLSCTVDLPHLQPNNMKNDGHTLRRGLHVQSRSYWAPANIGPYSQAIAVPAAASAAGSNVVEIVHLAGQIPLVPASMEMVRAADAAAFGAGEGDDFGVQTVLALQHLWRVGRAMGVRWWVCGTAFLSASESREEGEGRARLAREAWRGIHVRLRAKEENDGEDEGDVDVWDLKFGNRGTGGVPAVEGDGRVKLPNFEGVRLEAGHGEEDVLAPPCLVAEVLELPRAADVEWTSPGLTNCEDVLWDLEEVLHSAEVPVDGRVYTVYTAIPFPQEWLDGSKPLVVPCSRVWGPEGTEVAAAIAVRYCKKSDGS
ncbi:ATP binding L-PSP endoribonuclease family protein [Macrophomina phaseolina]|uniref:Diphthine--ammonia ligase n=1 Tax=Macrophomina phaseolina TaxID=35725 RepID=A0ABQ8GQB7_9PEZI|nr:ATP binding L-PSP endoribonuclease family protein [Macrophomina phaseolina]